MGLNKKTIKQIIFILLVAITFCVVLLNLEKVGGAVKWLYGILSPLILGICIAFVVNPLMRLFETKVFSGLTKKHRKLSRALSLLIAVLLILGMITLLLVFIIPEIRDTLIPFFKNLPQYEQMVTDWAVNLLNRFDITADWLLEDSSIDWAKAADTLVGFLSRNSQQGMVGSVASAAASLVGSVFNLLVGIIFAIYVLIQKESVTRFFRRFLRAFFRENAADFMIRVSRLASDSFAKFVSGQLFEAFIIAVLCFIGMLIFKFPYASVVSAIVGITALVPIFGAWIGGALGAALVLTVSPIKALLFILYLVVLQQLESNLIYPKVLGTSMGLPGLLVLASVIVGGNVSGIAGMIIGVPLCSVVYTLLKEAIALRLERKNIKSV